MIEQTLRSLCDSRYRQIIVIAGTFIVGLVLILPLVDLYSAERAEKAALLAELSSAHQVAEKLDQYETRVAEKTTQLAKFEARTVSAESLPELRTKLMDMARETGCSLRRLSVESPTSRPWRRGDDPIETPGPEVAKPGDATSAFTLESWPVNISLSGSDANLRSMLDRMDADGMLMHTREFEMHPASAGGKTLDVDMELWYFNLARNK
jgi:hypothetical protein